MTTREARGPTAADTEEESIASYLQRNPDFFERHQGLLVRLRLPHARGGSTISLVERQIEVLREQQAALESKFAEQREALTGPTHDSCGARMGKPIPAVHELRAPPVRAHRYELRARPCGAG